jgi:hypothetical protein
MPVAGGAAHVASPLQKVVLLAPVPEFRFPTGRFPVTSAARDTAPNEGAPPAFPCSTVVVVPREPSVETAVVFPPITNWLMVSVAAAVTFPDPAGVAHVPSPLQNVDDDALVPEFKLVTGRLPLTSVLNTTAPNEGNPAALPCRTVVVVPVDASVALACDPPPTMTALDVRLAALVTHVVHPTVPLVVMVPPVSGELKVMLVMVPVPAGVDHVPSPRQKVEALALAPPARLVTGRLPVTSAARFTAAKLGSPAALPCNNVVVVPVLARVCSP